MDSPDEPTTDSPVAKALGELLRTFKDADGKRISIEALAARINRKGLSAPYLYALQSGRKRNPSPENLQALADFFGVHISFFYGGDRNGPSPVSSHNTSTTSDTALASRPDQDVSTDSNLPVAQVPAPKVDLAARIEHLFALRLRPDGKRWSMRQVMLAARERGVALSVTYLNDLRKGDKDNPTRQQLLCMADIFGVSPNYFLSDDETIAHANEKLRQLGALEDPRVAEIANRARGLSEHDYRMLKALIDTAIRERDQRNESSDSIE